MRHISKSLIARTAAYAVHFNRRRIPHSSHLSWRCTGKGEIRTTSAQPEIGFELSISFPSHICFFAVYYSFLRPKLDLPNEPKRSH